MNNQKIGRRFAKSDLINRLIPWEWRAELSIGKIRTSHLVKNMRAWKEFKNLDRSRLRYVGVFGVARGGSHLICTQLNYHPNLFSLFEEITSYEKLSYRTFLTLSILLYDGLQGKRISQIKYLVYNKMNESRDKHMWRPELVTSGKFKYIFLIRNPLRVVISVHNAGLVRNRKDLVYPPSYFKKVIDRSVSLLRTFVATRKYDPLGAKLLLHERFCRDPEKELRDLYRFIDPALLPMPEIDPQSFFKRMYCCNTIPVEIEGWLCCPSCGRNVGNGNFNVLGPVSLERTMKGDLSSFFKDEDLEYFREKLGPELSDFWLNDSNHRYIDDIAYDAVEELVESEHLSRVPIETNDF